MLNTAAEISYTFEFDSLLSHKKTSTLCKSSLFHNISRSAVNKPVIVLFHLFVYATS